MFEPAPQMSSCVLERLLIAVVNRLLQRFARTATQQHCISCSDVAHCSHLIASGQGLLTCDPHFTLIVFCNYRNNVKVKQGWSAFLPIHGTTDMSIRLVHCRFWSKVLPMFAVQFPNKWLKKRTEIYMYFYYGFSLTVYLFYKRLRNYYIL